MSRRPDPKRAAQGDKPRRVPRAPAGLGADGSAAWKWIWAPEHTWITSRHLGLAQALLPAAGCGGSGVRADPQRRAHGHWRPTAATRPPSADPVEEPIHRAAAVRNRTRTNPGSGVENRTADASPGATAIPGRQRRPPGRRHARHPIERPQEPPRLSRHGGRGLSDLSRALHAACLSCVGG
jgi:hypothetical protein